MKKIATPAGTISMAPSPIGSTSRHSTMRSARITGHGQHGIDDEEHAGGGFRAETGSGHRHEHHAGPNPGETADHRPEKGGEPDGEEQRIGEEFEARRPDTYGMDRAEQTSVRFRSCSATSAWRRPIRIDLLLLGASGLGFRLLVAGAQRRGLLGRAAARLPLRSAAAPRGRLAHLHVELKLRGEPERHRVGRRELSPSSSACARGSPGWSAWWCRRGA